MGASCAEHFKQLGLTCVFELLLLLLLRRPVFVFHHETVGGLLLFLLIPTQTVLVWDPNVVFAVSVLPNSFFSPFSDTNAWWTQVASCFPIWVCLFALSRFHPL